MDKSLFVKLRSCEIQTFAGRGSVGQQRSSLGCADIVHNLLAAQSVQDVHAQCVIVCETYGFDFFALVEYIVRPNRPPLLFRMLDHVNPFAEHYDKQGLIFIDPGVRIATQQITPFIISEDTSGYGLAPSELRVVHDSIDFGLRQVFNAPFQDLRGSYGLVRFVHNEGGRASAKERAEYFHIQAELFLLSGYIHAALVQLMSVGTQDAILSEREKQVLQWAAMGINTARIGDLLVISENTVCNHLKNIRSKLGVRNTTHAVAKALTERLITI